MLSAVCAAVVCAGVTAVRAQDTPAQAAALAALKQKLSELDAQAGQTTNQLLSPVVVPPSGATLQPPGTPANPPPAPAPVPASGGSDFFTPVPPPSNPGAQAALQEKMPAPKPEPASPQTRSPSAATSTPTKATAAVNPQTEAVRTAEAKQAAQSPAKKAVEPKSNNKPAVTAVQQAKPAETDYPGKALGFKPVEAPPPPVSAEQAAALNALLSRYMANEVTPDEYQAERKKIMTGQ